MSEKTPQSDFRVLIAGGGIAGLALANALQHADIDYILLEARSEIAPQLGASVGIMPNGARVLDQVGCYDDIWDAVVPLTRVAPHFPNGDYVAEPDDGPVLGEARTGYGGTFLDRQVLLEILYRHIKDKDRILLGKRTVRVDHTDDRVVVNCTDGSSYHGDVLVGADGNFSKVRQEMWRLAEPGAISDADKQSMKAEYQCMFGISSRTKGLPAPGTYEYTYGKDVSTMFIIGREDRVFWFIFKRLDQVYTVGNIPKYTTEDADKFLADNGHLNLMPNGSVQTKDVFATKITYNLVCTEEADYQNWTWGRIACIGDAVHKMTPNAGAGGNASLESAAALANALYTIKQLVSNEKPSYAAIKQGLLQYQQSRKPRALIINKLANSLTRIHALKGTMEKLLAYYIFPQLGDQLSDMQSDILIGASMIEYLPPPRRSIAGTMPFNPSQGTSKQESKALRAVLALPFIGLFMFGLVKILGHGPPMAELMEMVDTNRIYWPGGSAAIRDIPYLPDMVRIATCMFAPSTIGYDRLSSWQMAPFLTDYGVLYSIFLIEAARRSSLVTPMQIPLWLGLISQRMTIGVISPIYFFLFWVLSPIENFKATDQRLTNMRFTTTVLPSMLIGYYSTVFVSYYAPLATTRLDGALVFQLFPIWVSALQFAFAWMGITPNTVKVDRVKNPLRDLPTINVAIGVTIALSAATWLYTLAFAPYSMVELFIPVGVPGSNAGMESFSRLILQWDEVLMVTATFMWLGYLFWDMKAAGMVQQGWTTLVLLAGVATAVVGPGAAIGLGWVWREHVLAYKRHKAAVTTTWAKEKTTDTPPQKANGHAIKG